MKATLLLVLVAACADETALVPLVPAAPEPEPVQREPATPPPQPEHDVKRCERVAELKKTGLEQIEEKRYSEAKKSYLKAIELDPADRDAPAALQRIDTLTNDQVGSSTAIQYAQGIGAARSPCDPKAVAQKKAPPPRTPAPPLAPGLTSAGAAETSTPNASATAATPATPPPVAIDQAEIRQDGNVIIVAQDQRLAKNVPTAQEVQKRLSREDARIVTCYTTALKRDPTLTGKATYKLTVDKDGKVSDANTSDNALYDQSVQDCITDLLKKIHLGKKLSTQVDIYYALAFSPRKTQAPGRPLR